jgi:putative pyruvate formate lyase activating enzyme
MSLDRRTFLKGVCLAGGALIASPAVGLGAADIKGLEPSYVRLAETGELEDRVERAYKKLESCDLCPRKCGVNRRKGQKGFCRAPEDVVVYTHQPHFGEEKPLVGHNGSGTIFFSNCNLRCVFCQNYPIAHEGKGHRESDEILANRMLDLQERGCHNINLVTPTHVMPHILNATRIAQKKGLYTPLCYNTGGYERKENIELLEGIVDLYLPDLKFMHSGPAEKYAVREASDYPRRAREAILEMNRQVGVLETDDRGIARSGLILRHLVMPNNVAGTDDFAEWVARSLPEDTFVNIMAQYRVEHMAYEYERINRSITSREYVQAIRWAREAGLERLAPRSVSQFKLHKERL